MSKPRRRISTKSAYWQFINDLAFEFYQDKSNLAKRNALHAALMKPHYSTEIDPETDETIPSPVGSYMQNLAYEVTKRSIKADLGASVTQVSEEILQDWLTKEDKKSGLLMCRPTAMLGDENRDIKGNFDAKLGESAYLLSKFRAWFSTVLYNQFADMAREYNRERKRKLELDAFSDDQDGNDELPVLTLELVAQLGLPDEPDPLRSKRAQLDKLLATVEDPLLRAVAISVALSPWTGESSKNIQERLDITRDKFRTREAKARDLLKPLMMTWLDEIQDQWKPSGRTGTRGSGN